MRIVPSKPLFTNMKQMLILNFKLMLDKIVSVLLNLDKNGFQTKLAPDLSQLVSPKMTILVLMNLTCYILIHSNFLQQTTPPPKKKNLQMGTVGNLIRFDVIVAEVFNCCSGLFRMSGKMS